MGLVLMGRAMLSKCLIWFSVDGWSCVPSLLFTWVQTLVAINEANGLQKATCIHWYTQCPQLCSRQLPTHASAGGSWTLPGKPRSVCSFLPGRGAHKVLSVPSKGLFPQSCVSSGSSMVGLMGDLLQEGLCHTQVCCTQSPCLCSSPLLTRTSTGDTQTQFWLSLCGVSGSWCTQGLFEPSEHRWRVCGLILNVILPLLPSCWSFSFALGCGISPQSHSSTALLFWVRGGDFQKFCHWPLSGFLWSAFKLSWH